GLKACSTRGRRSISYVFLLGLRRTGEELQRIHQLAIRENLVVQVSAGRATSRSDVPDGVAPLHLLPRFDRERAQMTVSSDETERVLQHDEIAVIARIRCGFNRSVGGGEDRMALLG